MITALSANKAYLAFILPVAALVFTQSARAASGNVQICNPSANCTIGEFLYDDSYSPITTATCTITSRYPNGTLFLSAVNMPASAEGDGWYAYTFTAPSTLGLYRTEVRCTTTTNETLALDKSFEIQTAPATSVPSANDVATSVWSYSSRSLSTFSTLVADVWKNATRTLSDSTASDISSTKSDVSSVKSDVSTIKSDVSGLKGTSSTTNITNIQNTTNTTNNMLEQIINRPIIENILEEASFTTTELQSKMEKSENLANQLLTSATYIKSKTNLIKGRGGDITKAVGQLETVLNSMDEQINWIAEQWDFPISSKLIALNKKLAAALAKVNSASQLKSLSSDLDSFIKLVGSSDNSSKSNTLFGQLKGKKELLSLLDKNYKEATTLLSDIARSQPEKELIDHINVLSTQVAAINQLPKMNKSILAYVNAKMDQKQLKNKTLSLRGIVDANRQMLSQKPNEPLRSLWFEEGSIVFKTLISNPSKSISQKVPVKYYLPKEVNRENITKTDEGLTVNYDSEKDQYFVSGNFTLDPGETKTLAIIVDDSAFHIDDAQILTMRKQAEELSKPLEHTAYFAQGVTLKSDINAACDKIDSLQKNGITPEAKIRGYREAMIEYKAAEEKLEKLKELATTAGSVGTLFGFVGGAQALAVWGLIIIMVAGFVFLTIYMRALKGKEKFIVAEPSLPLDEGFKNYQETPKHAQKTRFYFPLPIKYLAVIMVSIAIGGGSLYALGLRQKAQHSVAQQAQVKQEILGNQNQSKQEEVYKEITILVPEDSTLTIHSQPSINSPVLSSISASKRAKEVSREGLWVKIVLQDSEDKTIEGWVDGDFIETDSSDTKQDQKTASPSQKTVIIKDTPTGFLRVRKTPGGEEITKVNPGEQYDMLEEQTGWVKIVLEDGTSGWVSRQYVSY